MSDEEPLRVLLVDDNPADVILTKRSLARGVSPCILSVAEDGFQALAMLRQEGTYDDLPRPDVILLDLDMPGLDGRKTLVEIKADRSIQNIPVFILTSSRAEADIVASYGLQAAGFFIKPVVLDEIYQRHFRNASNPQS